MSRQHRTTPRDPRTGQMIDRPGEKRPKKKTVDRNSSEYGAKIGRWRDHIAVRSARITRKWRAERAARKRARSRI